MEKTKNILISIIVPVYNVEQYIYNCVNSILKQTFTDFEIILVDDGSTDNSPEICDFLQKNDNRVRVIHKENGGLSDARNVGMKIASGNLFMFVDSDDMIHEKFCELAIELLYKYDAQIVSFDMLKFESYEHFHMKKNAYKDYQSSVFYGDEIVKEYLSPQNRRIIYHGLCMKVYRRELFEGLEFDTGRLHEDMFITYLLMDRCKVLVHVVVAVYFYYQNYNGICHNYGKKNLLDEYDALKKMEAYFASREELRRYVVLFIFYEYRYMIVRTSIKKDAEVDACIRNIRKWTMDNINLTKISLKKKILLLMGVFFPRIYVYFKNRF